MDLTCPPSQDPTASKVAQIALPKANHRLSTQKKNDFMGNVPSPISNSHKTEAPTSTQKTNSKSKSKPGDSKVSHGRQNEKAVGNKPSRKNHAIVPIVHLTNPSISHHDLGVVQPGANASMEPYFSSNSRESKTGVSSANRPSVDRMGQSLLEIPNVHFNNGKREDNGVESTITNFAGSSFAQIKPLGGGLNKENLDGRSISKKFNGVFGSYQVDSNLQELATDKSADQLEGAAIGDFGACEMHFEEQGDNEVQVEGAGLEFAEPSQELVSGQQGPTHYPPNVHEYYLLELQRGLETPWIV